MLKVSKYSITIFGLVLLYLALFIDLYNFNLISSNDAGSEYVLNDSLFYYTTDNHCQNFHIRIVGQLLLIMGPLFGGILTSRIFAENGLLKKYDFLEIDPHNTGYLDLEYPSYSKNNKFVLQNAHGLILMFMVLMFLILFNPLYYVYYEYKLHSTNSPNLEYSTPPIPVFVILWIFPFIIYISFILHSEFDNISFIRNITPIIVIMFTGFNAWFLIQLYNVLLCG